MSDDGTCKNLPLPTGIPEKLHPSEKQFQNLVEEFWFEAYHVAKYLKRQDLWSVKFRMSGIYDLLFKMIEWSELAKHGKNYQTYHLGKNMQSWVDPTTWDTLHSCFAHFDSDDS